MSPIRKLRTWLFTVAAALLFAQAALAAHAAGHDHGAGETEIVCVECMVFAGMQGVPLGQRPELPRRSVGLPSPAAAPSSLALAYRPAFYGRAPPAFL